MTTRLEFTLLGTGSSGGVPRVGNDWGACDPSEPKNRRLRCSALCELYREGIEEPTRVLIDTSPDLRQQLLREGVNRLDAVFITHDHADQTHGLDDVRALALRLRRRLDIHIDETTGETLIPKFNYCFEGAGDYPPILNLQPFLKDYEARSVSGPSGDIELTPIVQEHGKIRSLGFRLGSIAYCNDVSDISMEAKKRLRGLDVLIVDALRYTPHPSHAHLDRVLEWISELQPKRTFLTNLHIDMDYRTLCEELPANIRPGYDGMRIIL